MGLFTCPRLESKTIQWYILHLQRLIKNKKMYSYNYFLCSSHEISLLEFFPVTWRPLLSVHLPYIRSFIHSYSCCSLWNIRHSWNALFHFGFSIFRQPVGLLWRGTTLHKVQLLWSSFITGAAIVQSGYRVDYRLDDRGEGLQILVGENYFSLIYNVQTESEIHIVSYTKGTGAVFREVKRQERETQPSHLSISEIKNERIIPPLPNTSSYFDDVLFMWPGLENLG
jgi:hypothetical protein